MDVRKLYFARPVGLRQQNLALTLNRAADTYGSRPVVSLDFLNYDELAAALADAAARTPVIAMCRNLRTVN
jgi:hypothetical protein